MGRCEQNALDMKKKLQVFVSSTYKDLIEERQAAVSAILEAGHIPAGMELFAAGDESQWDAIKRWIEASDVYMLILGGRYGSIEPVSSLSYTELEYDHAIRLKKPLFAVVIEQSALDERVKSKGTEVFELANPAKFGAFRNKVLSKMSSFFTDPKDIKLAAHKSIRHLEERHQMVGWVSGADVQEIRALQEELQTLREQNKKINRAKATSPTTASDEESQQLWPLLKSMLITVPAFVHGKETKSDLLSLFYGNREAFSQGVTNSVGDGEVGNWLFSAVGAPLEAHELVMSEKVTGARYRRLVLSKKGAKFLAFLDKLIHLDKAASVTPIPSGKAGDHKA